MTMTEITAHLRFFDALCVIMWQLSTWRMLLPMTTVACLASCILKAFRGDFSPLGLISAVLIFCISRECALLLCAFGTLTLLLNEGLNSKSFFLGSHKKMLIYPNLHCVASPLWLCLELINQVHKIEFWYPVIVGLQCLVFL